MKPVNAWSDELRQELAASLVAHAPTGAATEPRLQAAVATTAAHPGKLMRGRLAYTTAVAARSDPNSALLLATGLEYYHLASLVLDDLPCMDDADLRRGQPCVHRLHGDATAILTALAFINRAYALLGVALSSQPATVRVQAQICLDACLGTAGLVGGQARDLQFGTSPRTAREVGRVALAKTGAMLRLSLMLPALLGAPDERERHALNALSVYWSLALQAWDDLQDVLATSVDAGKTTRRDRALSRPNLAVCLGVPATRRRINRLVAAADRTVQGLASQPEWAHLPQFQQFFADTAASTTRRSRVAA